MLNERLTKMREKLWNTRPCITAERLVLATEAYQKFAGDAIPVFRAKVVNYIMENMTTLIMEDELVVGTATNKYRGANLHPNSSPVPGISVISMNLQPEPRTRMTFRKKIKR